MTCMRIESGQVLWRSDDGKNFSAVGFHQVASIGNAQHPTTLPGGLPCGRVSPLTSEPAQLVESVPSLVSTSTSSVDLSVEGRPFGSPFDQLEHFGLFDRTPTRFTRFNLSSHIHGCFTRRAFCWGLFLPQTVANSRSRLF